MTFFVQNAHAFWDTIQWTLLVQSPDAAPNTWDTIVDRPVLKALHPDEYDAQSIYFDNQKQVTSKIILSYRNEVFSETQSPNEALPVYYTITVKNQGIAYDAHISSSAQLPEGYMQWDLNADSITRAHLGR